MSEYLCDGQPVFTDRKLGMMYVVETIGKAEIEREVWFTRVATLTELEAKA